MLDGPQEPLLSKPTFRNRFPVTHFVLRPILLDYSGVAAVERVLSNPTTAAVVNRRRDS